MKKFYLGVLALVLMFSMAGVIQAAAPQQLDCEASHLEGELKYCSFSASVVNKELVVHGVFVNVGAAPVEKVEQLNLKVFDKKMTQIADGVFTGDKELAKISLKPGETLPFDLIFADYKQGDLSAISTEYEFNFTAAVEPSLKDGINIFVANQQIKPEVAPFIKDGSTLVPLRAIFESLKAKVSWDAATKTVTAKSDQGDTLTLKIGEKVLDLNGQKITFDVPSQIVDGSTFIPLRAVSEALGSHVFYGKTNNIVVISIASFE